jgi:hypothetical protein
MRWYALIEVGDAEAIDLFLRPDEPEWRGLLRVEEIECSVISESPN